MPRFCVIALALFASIPACAGSSLQIAILPRTDLPPGRGQCDLRIEGNGDVQLTIRRDKIVTQSADGQEVRDGGSDCNMALPARAVRNFSLQTIDGRGDVRLQERPSAGNDYAALVHIRDAAGGFARYHLRLTWDTPAPKPDLKAPSALQDDAERPPAPPGFVWNNALTFRGRGAGESLLDDRSQSLSGARVDIDMGGRVVASFAGEQPKGIRGKPRPLLFNGTVLTRDASQIRANVATEDHRLHGTMTIALDGAQNIASIRLNATDGQEHLRLTWDRR